MSDHKMNDIKRQLSSTSISTHVTQAEIDMARTEIALAAHPQSSTLRVLVCRLQRALNEARASETQ